MNSINNYLITDKTIAILYKNNNKSTVIEDSCEKSINLYPTKIVESNCYINGMDFKSRLKNTYLLTGLSYKAPIKIRDDSEDIYFSTSSPRVRDCSWINLSKVKSVFFDDIINKSIVIFNNNCRVELDISMNVLNNLINRASRLDFILRKRAKKV